MLQRILLIIPTSGVYDLFFLACKTDTKLAWLLKDLKRKQQNIIIVVFSMAHCVLKISLKKLKTF